MKVLDLIRKEKNCMLRLVRSRSKRESSFYEIVKKEKETCASFAVILETQKLGP